MQNLRYSESLKCNYPNVYKFFVFTITSFTTKQSGHHGEGTALPKKIQSK
jgi:hypothetical protein